MSKQDGDDVGTTGGLGRWWAAAAVVVVVIVAALVFVLVSPGKGPESSAPVPSTPAPTSSPAASSASAGTPSSSSDTSSAPSTSGWSGAGCNGTPGTAAVPTAAPKGVTWQPLGAMSVPTSRTLGPRKVNGVLRQCFQHSPAGAVMAAANMMVAASLSTDAMRQVFTKQMTKGPGRTQVLASLEEQGSGNASPAGFQVGACTPKACQVGYLGFGGGYYIQASFALVWSDGDWKMNGATGFEQPSITQTQPGGYVPWQPGQ